MPPTAARFRWPGRRSGEEPELVLARLKVTELVSRHVVNEGGWAYALDNQALEDSRVGRFVKALYGDRVPGIELALWDGSLFVLDRLELHPAIRGQRAGARLICDALSRLQRSENDIALGLVNPIHTIFDTTPHRDWNPPAGARDRLLRYYRSIGFRTCGRPTRPGEPYLIYYPMTGENVDALTL